MSQESLLGSSRLRLAGQMRARDPDEEHRAATPLELFFDLVFVVAIAQAAGGLHHGLSQGDVGASVVSYMLVFFAVWWAWMNVTWFCSAYDNDDVVYRLFIFITMAGVLILAAGIPRAFEQMDWRLLVFGYVVMRIALVTQWIRVARNDRLRRVTATRYAVGVTVCQIGWIGALALTDAWWLVAFAVLAPAELLVPVWAERAAPTPWHPNHIAERYGLFTIIVLGEAVLAASLAIQSASGALLTGDLLSIILGGLLIVFSAWWVYFDYPWERLSGTTRRAFLWGYGHALVWMSVAAAGAGLAVAVDRATGRSALSASLTGVVVAAPVAIYLLILWALHVRARDPLVSKVILPLAAGLTFAGGFLPRPVLAIGAVMAGLVVFKILSKVHGYVSRHDEAIGRESATR